mgnify:CR=1 FL=1
MKFKKFKNKLDRPFVVYADFESTLVPTGLKERTHKHVPNSVSFYFVCTFDNSRNKLYEFVGYNCVSDLVSELKIISKVCILDLWCCTCDTPQIAAEISRIRDLWDTPSI